MKRKDNTIQDKQFRLILEGTKKIADDKLKFRIMQQIKTEHALMHRTRKTVNPVRNMLSIFGVMYGIIICIASFLCLTGKGNELTNNSFVYLTTFIVFICAIYWLIICIDERTKTKKH